MITVAKFIVIAFGVFFILAGFVMLLYPKRARQTLRKAGSTNFINYAEITLRMIPAAALILYADYSKYPMVFKLFGWFMLATSIILYLVPPKLHHQFSNWCADMLKPFYFQLLSPFAFLFGVAIIYCVI
ncbi:MAG: hypothetical protein IPH34_05020 [Chitinophagaceae bacterium]|nr:hypothetical protein [Chitinophagaceae bacterium]MBK8310417.1 hypothetical protein [Chitinophagaceae bacterium]MBK8607944.1 hypothetical protein [Chitinophagaceae bacterium]MBP6477148.1 hypothetical protein [Chitinophagaceae bacterium]MBP7107644.1 hypothetical protein [Chitinophagaceae bacterium]